MSGRCRECGVGCGGGVLTCIQVLYVLGQPSVYHTMHVCTNLHMYVCMCTQVHVHTYTTYTRFEKYSCITIVSRVDIKMFPRNITTEVQ